MTPSKPEVRIGTSGYQYDHWRGLFYPAKLPKSRWLQYYSEKFDTVEINNTFYHLPSEQTFDTWRAQAVQGFLYVLKFSRYGTHMKKLKEPEEPVERFMKLAAKLNGFLGPILVQLPPRWRVVPERLEAFLAAVPGDRRWAVEIRDSSWLCDEVYSILRKYNAALCYHDLIEDHPRVITADWIYERFHGASGHAGNYERRQLVREAGLLREYVSEGMDIFVYFNNDVGGHAVFNALDLRKFVSS